MFIARRIVAFVRISDIHIGSWQQPERISGQISSSVEETAVLTRVFAPDSFNCMCQLHAAAMGNKETPGLILHN